MFPPRPLARTSRRSLLRGGAAGAVGLAALGLGVPRLPGSAPQTASAQTGPWAGGDVPLASRSNQQMAVAARAFLDGLGADQLGSVWYPDLSDPARTKWSNFPAGASPRPGVALGDLGDNQRVLLHDLLRASTSSEGYHKMTGAMRADDALHDLGGEALFGSVNYYTTVFGSPEDANWAWMLTDHHMSALFTYGMDWLGLHYQGSSPLPGGPGGPGGGPGGSGDAPRGGGTPTP